jgi:mannose-6-phosphate isomerase-like protein (cupin superfamily)
MNNPITIRRSTTGDAAAGARIAALDSGHIPQGDAMRVVKLDELPSGSFSHELEGAAHGDIGVSLIFTAAAPGQGPSLHLHDYVEVHVVQEGEAVFTAGDEQRVVRAGEIAIVPPGMPHRFEASGDGTFREIGIHISPRFVTEWIRA